MCRPARPSGMAKRPPRANPAKSLSVIDSVQPALLMKTRRRPAMAEAAARIKRQGKPMTKRKPAQMELFAGAGDARDVHALGLLGWSDPLWTKRFEIPLL